MINDRLNKRKRYLKDHILRSFLVVSIIFSVFLVSNCDDLFNHIPIFPGNGGNTSNPPEFGGSESSSYATSLFKSIAEGATGEIGGSAATWALSALGLSDSSPDYTDQLNKIDQDLIEISNQLSAIQTELSNIYNELLVINCADWSQEVLNARSSINNRMLEYQNMILTAKDTSNPNDAVSISDIRSWVNNVLGDSTVLNPDDVTMETALTNLENDMLAGPTGGTIPACITTIPLPADNTFGTDTVYYNQVKLLVNYFYTYQVQALFLYSEAKHFRAWQTAGAPNSNFLSADSVSDVCLQSSLICNNVATFTNTLYNSLIDQFSLAGAPYTDENFVLMYNQNSPYLWPKSLEDFTTAAGDNCADPLTSANPCGKTAGFYDDGSMQSVSYKGYSGWLIAGKGLINNLLAGWSSGTAGHYLQTELGFKNMKNKIIISSNTVKVQLNETDPGTYEYFIPFFDTDWDYNFLPGGGGPAQTEIQFREGPLVKSRTQGGLCRGLVYYYMSIDYNKNSQVPSNRNSFYEASGHCRYCQPHSDYDYTTSFSFSVLPGYLASQKGITNHESSARQFRWPVRGTSTLTCTENRLNKNVGGAWTMCGDDFTAFLEFNVPRPVTCDNPHAIACKVSASAVANAKSVFGNN